MSLDFNLKFFLWYIYLLILSLFLQSMPPSLRPCSDRLLVCSAVWECPLCALLCQVAVIEGLLFMVYPAVLVCVQDLSVCLYKLFLLCLVEVPAV